MRGIIQKIEETKLIIKITAQSACSNCHAQSSCNYIANSSDCKDKEVEAYSQGKMQYSVGQEIELNVESKLGLTAIILGYVAPFCVVMIALILGLVVFEKEWIAGLLSLISIIPYYGLLYLKRDLLRKTFCITVP